MGGCCGSRVAPRLNPVECNALSHTAAGLLVPETEVVGVAPGTAVGDENSVDVHVTPPTDGACPEVWTIAARLTPVHGTATPTAALDLMSVATNAWADVPGFNFTAPETGVYRVQADASGTATWSEQNQFNRLITTRLTHNGAAVPDTIRGILQVDFVLSGGVTQSGGINGSATISTLLRLSAGDVVQVQGSQAGDMGTATALWLGPAAWSLLSWNKVAD